MQSRRKPTSSSKSARGDDDMAMELYVWGPSWGMPSINVESMQAIACVRFGRAPVKIIECNNPWRSKNSTLPFFRQGSKVFYSNQEIATYLRQKNYSCDFGLSSKEGADVIAYSQLVTDSLHPALQYFSFVQEQNYVEIIRPAYGLLLPWLYKMWYTDRRLKENAHVLMQALYAEAEFEPEQFEPEFLNKAQQCIKFLSDKLGTNDFLVHPNSPTSLDAIVFSYLSAFVKIPWLHCPIKEYIKATPNLERYVARIHTRYFSLDTKIGPGGDTVNNKPSSSSSTSSNKESEWDPLVHKVLGFTVGIGALILFAYKNGMFRMSGHRFRLGVEDAYWE